MSSQETEPDNLIDSKVNYKLERKLTLGQKLESFMSSGMNRVATLTYQVNTETEEKVTNSPLHMAVREGNNKTVDTILYYMSRIDENASIMFKDIFHKLIIFQNMKAYIENLPITTKQMLKKQVIKVKHAHSDEIIKMTQTNTIYVDDKFYRQSMKEK